MLGIFYFKPYLIYLFLKISIKYNLSMSCLKKIFLSFLFNIICLPLESNKDLISALFNIF
jgi:hypothetical protein